MTVIHIKYDYATREKGFRQKYIDERQSDGVGGYYHCWEFHQLEMSVGYISTISDIINYQYRRQTKRRLIFLPVGPVPTVIVHQYMHQ